MHFRSMTTYRLNQQQHNTYDPHSSHFTWLFFYQKEAVKE